jgi:hypothetical protein
MSVIKVLDINSRYFNPCEINGTSILNREYRIANYYHGAYYIVPEKDDPLLSNHINNIMEYARDQDCTQICVDGSGEEYDQFTDFIDFWN